MRKPDALLLSAAVCALFLSGCAVHAQPAESGSALTGVVNTDGSTSMEKTVKALGEMYMSRHSGVTINFTGSGSGAGVESVLHGIADLGLVSRPLTQGETADGAVGHLVALDGIAVVIHPQNPVNDLTMKQVVQIFTGQAINWSELGGADAPIAAYGREGGSGTRGAFEETLGVEDLCVYTNEYSSSGDVTGSVAGNPNAIGYVSLSAVNDSVKALYIEGAACTEDTIRDGSYPLQRPFLMVTKEGVALSPAAQAFLDYATSSDAAGVIALAGVTAPEYE